MEKKEAMKILKDFYDKSALFSIRTALDTVIPELKESDGERTRERLIAFLSQCKAVYGDSFQQFGLNIDEALAWLEKQGEQKPAEWCDDDSQYVEDTLALLAFGASKHSISQVQNWLNSLKYRVRQQSKQEWSEEDKHYIFDIIDWLNTCKAYNNDIRSQREIDENISWLKYLSPQNRWKPSEEQMNAIMDAIDYLGCTKTVRGYLVSLYEDLKKLREE